MAETVYIHDGGGHGDLYIRASQMREDALTALGLADDRVEDVSDRRLFAMTGIGYALLEVADAIRSLGTALAPPSTEEPHDA